MLNCNQAQRSRTKKDIPLLSMSSCSIQLMKQIPNFQYSLSHACKDNEALVIPSLNMIQKVCRKNLHKHGLLNEIIIINFSNTTPSGKNSFSPLYKLN